MDKLECDLNSLEQTFMDGSKIYPPADVQRISMDLTRTRTEIITKKTKFDSHSATVQRSLGEKRKRLRDLEEFEKFLQDLIFWRQSVQAIVEKEPVDESRNSIYAKMQELEVKPSK